MNAIVRRDLNEHAWALVPLTAVVLLLLAAQAVVGMYPRLDQVLEAVPMLRLLPVPDGPLDVFRLWVLFGLTPLAWLLVNRFVVVEYQRSGWELLERLPIGLARVLYAKVVFSLIALGALLAFGWFFVLSVAEMFGRDVRDAPALALLQGGAGFLALAYGYLLAAATVGRHRLLVHTVVACAAAASWSYGLEPSAWPGLSFLRQDLETGQGGDALAAAGWAGALVAAAFWLVTWRRGRWARALQGPLATRPLLGVGSAALVLAVVLADEAALRPELRLEGAAVHSGSVSVRVPHPGARARAEALAARLSASVGQLQEALELSCPSLAVDFCEALDGATFERAVVRGRRGVLVRADFLAPDWRGTAFLGWAMYQVFDAASGARLRGGGWRLLLEGVPGWLVVSGGTPAERARDDLRAACGARVLLDASEAAPLLPAWGSVRERVGRRVARSLARWVLERWEAKWGPGRVAALARDGLRRRSRLLGGVGDDDAGFGQLLTKHSGASASQLEAWLRAELAGLTRAHHAALAALPRLGRRTLVVEGGALAFEAAPARGRGPVALLHGPSDDARGWDAFAGSLARDEALPGQRARTARRYPAGARVRYAFATFVPELSCDLVHGWEEVTIR